MSGPRRPVGVRCAAVAAAAACLLVVAGCGGTELGADARLQVTQDFGTRSLAEPPEPAVRADETALGLLRQNVPGARAVPDGREAGRLVLEAVGDVTNGTRAGRSLRWSLYVNGVGRDPEDQEDPLNEGDIVWWDHHDVGQAPEVPAVVGSFPAPFRPGPDGKRLPVRVECSPADLPACQTVQDAMTAAGVFAAQGGLQQSISDETLRIIVGPWERIRDDDTVGLLEGGPRASGVYARPAADGRSIAILDPQGRTTRTLGPGSGLIAATRLRDGQPVWILTAPDAAGVAAVAQGLDQGNLKDHFALAVDRGRAVAVPEVGVAVRP